MTARVLVGGLWHETNTFSAVPTDLAAFRAYQFAEGAEMLEQARGANTEIGGVLAAAPDCRFALVPTIFAGAVPSGLVTREAYADLAGRVAAGAQAALANGGLDGVVLALHGAMAAEGEPDADAALARRVRSVVGPGCPMVVTFDIHANLSPTLFEAADILVGYDTYPHTDMAARGAEAARLLRRLIDGERPGRAFRKLPLLTAPQMQTTDAAPMRDVIADLHALEAEPAIWTGSVAVGFPYADIPHLGVAVTAYADSQDAADAAADRIAGAVWSRRAAFTPSLTPPGIAVTQALDIAERAKAGPAVLVDVADNVGGGAPGDGTVLLQALLDAGETGPAAVVIWDPEAARAAVAAGVGAAFAGHVGGKADDNHGAPVMLEGLVSFADDVTYRRESSYMTGQSVALGRVAVVDAGDLRVVLTERRAMPFDAGHLRACGVEPETLRLLVVKSAIAWKAGFGAMAAGHVEVDTPGICASRLSRFRYTKGAQHFYPLDEAAGLARGVGIG